MGRKISDIYHQYKGYGNILCAFGSEVQDMSDLVALAILGVLFLIGLAYTLAVERL